MNKVFLMGNLGRDPELRSTGGGSSVATFSLAVNERFRGQDGKTQERVTWVQCETWGRNADNLAKYCSKGSQVLIEGSLQLDTWEDKATGEKRSKLKVRAFRITFLNRAGNGNGASSSGQNYGF